MNTDSTYRHLDFFKSKVNSIHGSIAEIIKKGNSAGLDKSTVQQMCAPYYDMLENIYRNELPFREASEASDVLFRLEGPAVSDDSPQVSIVSNSLNKFRYEINNLTKSFAGIDDTRKRLPKSLEFGLSGLARGSLYLGFVVFTDKLIDESKDTLLGDEDVLIKATKNALKTLGIITKFANQIDYDELKEEIPDPRIRDISLGTLKRLSPSKRSGIDSINILGKSMPDNNIRTLTPDTRKTASDFIKEKVIKADDYVSFTGIIREVDLDAQRFDLRYLESQNINDIRCIYPDDFSDSFIKEKLNVSVEVEGEIEYNEKGEPKLMKVSNLS